MFTEGIPGSSPEAAVVLWILLSGLWLLNKITPGFRLSRKPLPYKPMQHPEL